MLIADRRLLYANAFLRALATGLMGVLLGLYLAERGLPASSIGLVIGSGLTGAAVAALVVTYLGDRFGRRRSLVVLSALTAAGGVGLMATGHLAMVCAIAFLGMVNGMGRDRGAALVLDHAILPSTARPQERTRAFAWYNVLQDVGHALGAIGAGLPAVLQATIGLQAESAYALALSLYVLLNLGTVAVNLGLSPAVEPESTPSFAGAQRVSPESRLRVRKIAGLFLVDSLAGGFIGSALLSYFFFERFGASGVAIAGLFFVARIANAVSHLGAAWLAARIGLINTMVFTHIPASLALVAVALVPEFWMAAMLFVIRELLVEMDVPTRQSYVMAVVQPAERTWASGITSLVRVGGWAVAPFVAGFLMQGVALGTPLVIGAGMKIGYDLLLYRSFRHLHPPEERSPESTS